MQGTTRHGTLRILVAAVVATVLSVTAMAEMATVRLSGGRTVTGEIGAETETTLTLRVGVGKIPLTVDKSDIESIERRKTTRELYIERRAAIADDNLEERYNLANWLRDEQAYALAKVEVDDLLKRYPDDERLRLLSRLIETRLKLDAEPPKPVTPPKPPATDPAAPTTPGTSPGTPGTSPGTPTVPGVTPTPSPVSPTPDVPDLTIPPGVMVPTTGIPGFVTPERGLTENDINTIKAWEVELRTRPQVRFTRQDLEEFLDRYAHEDGMPRGRRDRQTFMGLAGWQQLEFMFRHKAREFYGRARIVGDPTSMQTFKTLHRTFIQTQCADCHNSGAGGFFLFDRNVRLPLDEVVYTNYLQLHEYENARGFMLDRHRPERSLLVQYSLPRELAQYPHPAIEGHRWRAPLRGVDDPRYRELVQWITSLGTPKSEYGVTFEVPGLRQYRDQLQRQRGGAESAVQPLTGPSTPATGE